MRNTLFIAMLTWMLPFGTNAQIAVGPDEALAGAIHVKDAQMLLDALKNGAELNRRSALMCVIPGYGIWSLEKATPLHQAISVGWYEGVLELLRAGAKPNADSEATISGYNWKNGCTARSMDAVSPILLASLYNNIDIAKVLVIAGSDTKGLTNMNFVRKCNVNGVEVKLVMWHLRQNCSEAFKEVLKDGKKSAWAANGLPAPGAKP